jgi:hypothetical protein
MTGFEDDDLLDFNEYSDDNTLPIVEDDIFTNPQVDDEPSSIEDDLFGTSKTENSELISNLLAQRGIIDASKIQIEDEDGNIQELDFNSLPIEEQLEILQQETPELDDSEIETINYLRENGVGIQELIEYHRNQAIQEYLQSQQTNYTVDNLSDEELYKLDIAAKYEDLSEEELEIELQKELNNPDLFKKKVDKLREVYKQEEIAEQEELAKQSELEEEQNYQTLVDSMVEIAQGTNELFDLELEDEDKEDVLQFLLSKDMNGQSEFVKLLNDPNALFQLAWFAVKGQEAFSTIHDYYKKEIDSARKAKGPSLTSQRTVVKKESKPKEDPYGLNDIFNKK